MNVHFLHKNLLLIAGIALIAISNCTKKSEIVTDIDGNIYNTVTIGSQIWMVENLKVTRYRNGDPINNVTDKDEWKALTTSAYCNYNNDTSNVIKYGRLYNWFAVNDFRNIAPEGWHVPTAEEIQILYDYLGGDNITGGSMKEAGTEHWLVPNAAASNESGFTALPGGYRFTNDSIQHPIGGTFHTLGSCGFWWTTTNSYQIYSWSSFIYVRFADVVRDYTHKTYGFSVRCIKD